MHKIFAAFLTLIFLTGQSAAQDGDNPILVELFTSQGCSSCPPADGLFEELVKRDDLVALALHVDYWDYLGWKDTMGRPENTKRQKGYAHMAGSRSIYTPQMVVAGRTHVIGHKPMELADAIARERASSPAIGLTLEQLQNGRIRVSADALPGLKSDLNVIVARFVPKYDVAIRRGENAGRTITYVNAVTAMEVVSRWDGKRALMLHLKVTGDQGVAVLLQEPGPGRVLAAATLR